MYRPLFQAPAFSLVADTTKENPFSVPMPFFKAIIQKSAAVHYVHTHQSLLLQGRGRSIEHEDGANIVEKQIAHAAEHAENVRVF